MYIMTKQICIKWNEFENNIVSYHQELRRDSDFHDVTLVCDEDQHIEAHRIILSACSSVLGSVLKRNKHSHHVIYMRGVKAGNLEAIVDFIYHGEANISQGDLDGFLALGYELQLKGLFGSISIAQEPEKNIKSLLPKLTLDIQPLEKNGYSVNSSICEDDDSQSITDTPIIEVTEDTNLKNLGDKVDFMMKTDSMIETFPDGAKCTVCGSQKKGKFARQNMKQHIYSHVYKDSPIHAINVENSFGLELP